MTLPEYDLNSEQFWGNCPELSLVFQDISGNRGTFSNGLVTVYLGVDENESAMEQSKSVSVGNSAELDKEGHLGTIDANLQALDNFSKIIKKVIKQIKRIPDTRSEAREQNDSIVDTKNEGTFFYRYGGPIIYRL